MLDENKHEATETAGNKRRAVDRRSFLRGFGGVVAGAAVISKVSAAHAGNNWNSGALARLSDDQLIDMYTKMLKSRWWE